jgi:hypothetical protein
MAKFKLEPGEQKLMEGSVPYLKSRFQYIAGPAYLTDRRFVHTNDLMARGVGGLLAALVKPRIDLEVPLDSIAQISRSQHGRKNESVLVISTADGQEHRMVADFDEWFPAFQEALSSHRATRLVELEPGAWTAVRS